MKKLFNPAMLAVVAMLLGVTSVYAELSTTIRWNIPGSLKIYVGGSSETYLASVPDDVTEFVATINNSWGTTYLDHKSGYVIEKVVADGTELFPISNGMYKVDMSLYDGKTVEVTMAELVFDKTLTVNVINGRDALSATMWGTDREISFVTGVQEIPYSSQFEEGIDIIAPANGAENPYILQDGVEKEWKTYYSWDNNLYHKDPGTGNTGFPFSDGTNFEIKYCETPDSEATPDAVITLDYADDTARAAITFIFNITKMETIYERDSFTVKEGESIRLVFNTKDYDVTIDGTPLEATDNTTPYVFTAEGDRTISIAAEERSYGTTTVSFAVTDLDGVELRDGALDGELITADQLTAAGTKTYSYIDPAGNAKTVELTKYKATVSTKSPKIFVSEAEGYWLEACEYMDGSDHVAAYIATPGYELNIVSTEIKNDDKLVVFVSVDGANATMANIHLQDRNRNAYELASGYNEFMIDADYCSPLSVSTVSLAEGTAMAVFNNMVTVSKNEDTGAYSSYASDETAIHIYAGRPVPTVYTVSARISDEAQDAEILVDRIFALTSENTNHKTFKNCEVSVTPRANQYLLDDEEPLFEGNTHVFKVSKDHDIYIGAMSSVTLNPQKTETNEAAEYYNLQGQRIEKPASGLVIVRKGSEVSKVLLP